MSGTTSTFDDDATLVASLSRSWGLIVAWGVASIAFGAVLLAWPGRTLLVVALLTGIWLIVGGVLGIIGAFGPGLTGGTRALFIVSGVLSLVIGAALVANIVGDVGDQAKALSLLSLLIGAGWLVSGVGELIGGLSSPGQPGRGWTIASGVVGIIGSIIILAWPLSSLAVIAVIGGIFLIILGVVRVAVGLSLRGRA
jgi:uncharacterized membrane protein HdeD (DUF308 family)